MPPGGLDLDGVLVGEKERDPLTLPVVDANPGTARPNSANNIISMWVLDFRKYRSARFVIPRLLPPDQ